MSERVVVVGGDVLALGVCAELARRGCTDVTLLWREDAWLAERARAAGATFVAGIPYDLPALRAAGVEQAACLIAVDDDDRINLETALSALEICPALRLVLRQYNRTLAAELVETLPNCAIVSLESLAAATYASAAMEPTCFYGLEFPEGSGRLVGFARRPEATFDFSDGAVRRVPVSAEGDADVVAAAEISRLRHSGLEQAVRRPLVDLWRRTRGSIESLIDELDPLLRVVLLAGLLVFVFFTDFFARALHLDPLTAAYFVVSSMTTTGYGDISLADKAAAAKVVGIAMMLTGIVLTNVAVAFFAAALVRAQYVALWGLRTVHLRNHIVILGAGRVGSRVIDFLRPHAIPMVIVDREPNNEILRLGRNRAMAVLTGNANSLETLEACNLRYARSAIVLTDSDTSNVEVGLAIRSRHRDLPIVVRIRKPQLAAAVAHHLALRRTYAATALAAPAIAGLALDGASRRRIEIADRWYDIQEYAAETPLADGAFEVCAFEGRSLRMREVRR